MTSLFWDPSVKKQMKQRKIPTLSDPPWVFTQQDVGFDLKKHFFLKVCKLFKVWTHFIVQERSKNNAPRWGESPRGWNVSFIRLQFSPGKIVNEPASRKTLARLMCLLSALMQIWFSTSRNSDTQGFTITEVFQWEWNIEGGNCNGLSEPFPDVPKCVSLVAAVKVTADRLTCLFGRAMCDYAPSIFTQLSFKKASMDGRAPEHGMCLLHNVPFLRSCCTFHREMFVICRKVYVMVDCLTPRPFVLLTGKLF